MTRQKPWSKHEAAILLDGYLRIVNSGVPKKDVIEDVSSKLRTMAILQGEEIDDIYRNTNGISFQLSSMESAYHGYTIMKPATHLFKEVVELYRNNPDEFKKLLTESLTMTSAKKNPSQDDFMSWLAFKTTSAKRAEFRSLYNDINKLYNRAKGLNCASFFEDISIEKVKDASVIVNSDTLFRVFHRKKYEASKEALDYVLQYLHEFTVTGTPQDEAPAIQEAPVSNDNSLDLDSIPAPVHEAPASQDDDVLEESYASSHADIPETIIESASLPVADSLIEQQTPVIESHVNPAKVDEPKASNSEEGAADLQSTKPESVREVKLEDQIEAVLWAECEKNSYGTTVSFIRGKLPNARPNDIKSILTSAPWAKYELGVWKYIAAPESTPEVNDSTETISAPEPTRKVTETDTDLTLKSRYPVVYKRLINAFEEAAQKGLTKLTIDQLNELTGKISRTTVLQDILSQASWVTRDGQYYILVDSHDDLASSEQVLLSFSNRTSLAFSKPAKLVYFGEELSGPCAWKELYVRFFEALYDDYPHLFSPGMRFSSKVSGPVDLGNHDMFLSMRAPRLLNCGDKNLILETNLSADHIVDRVKYLLDRCRVDYENVEIYYTVAAGKKESEHPQATSQPVKSSTTEEKSSSKVEIEPSKKTKFVHTPGDQKLMDADPDAFRAVYYALKKRTDGKNIYCGTTALYNDLEGKYLRRTITEILEGASWAKKSGERYFAFCDADREQAFKQKAEEKERDARTEFFAWLPSAVPAAQVKDLILDSQEIIETLVQKKLLKQTLFLTTTICQVEGAEKQVKRAFSSKRKQDSASTLLKAYATYLREKKNLGSVEPKVDVTPDEGWIRFDFSNSDSFYGTVPVYCALDGQIIDEKNWARVLVAIADREIAKNNLAIQNLYKHALIPNRKDLPFFLKKAIPGQNCIQLSNGYWINVNYVIPRLLDQIQALCLQAGYTKRQAVFYGIPRQMAPAREKSKSEEKEQLPLPSEAPLYSSILSDKFVRGFRLGSGLDMKKFKRYYEEKTGSAIETSDSEIETIITCCGIRYDDKIFVPAAMLPPELREELLAFIRDSLNAGKPALYYEAIFREFSERFLDHYIYSAEMLRSYISYYNNGEFFLSGQYISKDGAVEANPYDEVKEYLISARVPVESDKICLDLSHIPQRKIMQILGSNAEFVNNGVLVNNGTNSYFHVDIIQFSQEDLDNIRVLIEGTIKQREFISGTELVDTIRVKLPHITDNNSQISSLGLRDAIKFHLRDYFSFAGNVISAKNKPISMADVFSSYAKNNPEFTIAELVKLAEEMNSSIYFDSVYESAIRVDAKRFIAKAMAHFNIEETDAVIDRFCQTDFVSLQDITAFSFFPDAGYPWNTHLLESYVYAFSKKYRLLHSGFNRGSSVGAVVKQSSGINSFDELLSQALANSDTRLNKEDALSFFVNRGFLARRNYSNIEAVLLQAKTKRNTKERE